jgi:D-sedoheptulose 7-phosphate isomerase
MDRKNFLESQIDESIANITQVKSACGDALLKGVELIIASMRNRGKLMLCGNGGSAADAQHLAAECIVRLSKDVIRPGLPAIALTTDTSVLTAGGNDFGFDAVFARQVQALGHPEDILLAITTSGNSANILAALEVAKEKNIKTIGLYGGYGGECAKFTDVPIIIPSLSTQRIQEVHILLGHIMIELVERELYGSE